MSPQPRCHQYKCRRPLTVAASILQTTSLLSPMAEFCLKNLKLLLLALLLCSSGASFMILCCSALESAPNQGDPRWWGEEAESSTPSPSKMLVFTEPAKHWTDAAPVGNGRLGAMVWGGVANDTLQLNDDTLWTGVPGDYTNPEAPAVLSRVRKLVDDGEFADATEAAFNLSGLISEVYQPLGNINLAFGGDSAFSSYSRVLDLTTATVTVKYVVNGVEFTREHFCSHPHQVFVTKLAVNKPAALSFTAFLDSKLDHRSRVESAGRIVMEGSCPGTRTSNDSGHPRGIQFSAVLDMQIAGGDAVIRAVDGKKLEVEGADSAVLLLAASSSFEGPFTKPSDSKKDPTVASLNTLDSIKDKSFDELFARHLDDYRNLFDRVSLQLSKGSNATTNHVYSRKSPLASTDSANDVLISTAERVKSFKIDEDPSLVELLFNYGRYLLISCSRPGTQPANLQGIWNKDVEPAWDAAPHLNINLQMNYWPSLSCNLRECQEPLFDFMAALAVNGAKTAKVNYEANGWVAHQVTDLWAKTSPDRGNPVWALWPMGGGWLCTHLWEHYSFTTDKAFLEKTAYPLLEGCASFLLDWLIEGHGGYLETNPSTSPEHSFIAPDGQTASVSNSTTMDISIIKEVFSIMISSSEVLGKSKSSLISRIKEAVPKLPPMRISPENTIMEWAEDFKDPQVHHRHVSHLFGLFPGHTITLESTPELSKAAANTLIKRGDEGPGWSTTWKMALWAHLQDGQHSYKLVKQLINLVDPDHEADFEGGVYSNLFTAHPPFQIDANFGFTAAIAEMLVQSTIQDIYLIPALPGDKWADGCVRGLKARGGVTVSICWKEMELHEARILSENENTVRRLHYGGKIETVKLTSKRIHAFNRDLKFLKTYPLMGGPLP